MLNRGSSLSPESLTTLSPRLPTLPHPTKVGFCGNEKRPRDRQAVGREELEILNMSHNV